MPLSCAASSASAICRAMCRASLRADALRNHGRELTTRHALGGIGWMACYDAAHFTPLEVTMMAVSFRSRVLGVLVLLFVFTAVPAAAQDMDAMAKWTAYTVVHYKIVGEHSGTAPLLMSGGMTRQAQVMDRVEFELDWNQTDYKLVGTPVIRNFASKLGALSPMPNCPLPKLEGPVELMTLVAVKGDGPMAMSGIVTLQGKKDLPAGAIPSMNEFGCQAWTPVAAKSEAVEMNFQLPPAMMLAMPGGGYQISPDGKSMTIKSDGWVWTCTPTGVK